VRRTFFTSSLTAVVWVRADINRRAPRRCRHTRTTWTARRSPGCAPQRACRWHWRCAWRTTHTFTCPPPPTPPSRGSSTPAPCLLLPGDHSPTPFISHLSAFHYHTLCGLFRVHRTQRRSTPCAHSRPPPPRQGGGDAAAAGGNAVCTRAGQRHRRERHEHGCHVHRHCCRNVPGMLLSLPLLSRLYDRLVKHVWGWFRAYFPNSCLCLPLVFPSIVLDPCSKYPPPPDPLVRMSP